MRHHRRGLDQVHVHLDATHPEVIDALETVAGTLVDADFHT